MVLKVNAAGKWCLVPSLPLTKMRFRFFLLDLMLLQKLCFILGLWKSNSFLNLIS